MDEGADWLKIDPPITYQSKPNPTAHHWGCHKKPPLMAVEDSAQLTSEPPTALDENLVHDMKHSGLKIS